MYACLNATIYTVHSHRGGSGKSVLSLNLSLVLAKNGYNVLLVDLDMRAPSLYYMLQEPPVKYWINDYLEDECGFEETLIDLTEKFGLKGRFKASLANPDIDAIKETLGKSRRWEMNALKKLIRIRKTLSEDYDFIFFDTSPGIHYSSINALIASDNIILVVVPDRVDVKGALAFIKEIYDTIKTKSYLIVNKTPIPDISRAIELGEKISSELKIPLLAAVPYYNEVVLSNGVEYLVLSRPDHPFTRIIESIADKITVLSQRSS